MDTVIDTAIALVTTAILTGTLAIARKRYKLLNQRDALLVELSDLRHGMLMQKAYELSMTPRAGFETRSGQKNQNE